MNILAGARDLLLVIIFGQVIAAWGWATWYPVSFGQWLQQIDNGRFEYLDCDCTTSLD